MIEEYIYKLPEIKQKLYTKMFSSFFLSLPPAFLRRDCSCPQVVTIGNDRNVFFYIRAYVNIRCVARPVKTTWSVGLLARVIIPYMYALRLSTHTCTPPHTEPFQYNLDRLNVRVLPQRTSKTVPSSLHVRRSDNACPRIVCILCHRDFCKSMSIWAQIRVLSHPR